MIKFLKKRWYIVVLILVSIVFLFYRNIIITGNKNEKKITVKKQNLKEILTLTGEIDAEEKTTAKFQTSGLLTWVGVKEGDYVKKYQGLASLDRRELEKNLKKYLNTYMNERRDFDQQKEDYKDKAITDAMQRILDETQDDMNSAIIDVELKDIALKFATLITPIEGIVTRVGTPYAGVNITPTNGEFDIVNPKTVFFSANAEQSEVIKLNKNMEAEIILDPYSDKKLIGKIYFIGFIPKTGETGTVYEIKLKLNDNNDNYQYKVGMTGDINFTIKERKNVLSIPDTALKTDNKKQYVWKDENGKKIKKDIQTGEQIDGEIEVTSGLNEGDIIYD